jgi:plastocyanin
VRIRDLAAMTLAIAVCALVGAAPPSIGASHAPAPSDTTCPTGATLVDMLDFTFAPADLTVSAGTTVCWTNKGYSLHTVTSGHAGAFRFR